MAGGLIGTGDAYQQQYREALSQSAQHEQERNQEYSYAKTAQRNQQMQTYGTIAGTALMALAMFAL